MPASSSLGTALRDARRRVRLSQSAVAGYVGTTRQTIAAFEHEERQPLVTHLLSLANLYRVSLDELVSVRPPARRTPEIRPRFQGRKDLSDLDRRELESFAEYLSHRERSTTVFPERTKYESVADTAARLLLERNILIPPVPIEEVVATCGIEVRFTPLDELAGALLLPTHHAEPYGILVSSDQPSERQRFTLAHEFGHLVLGHVAEHEDAFVDHVGRRFIPSEVQADMFAGELLIPATMLKTALAALPRNETLPLGVFRLASSFSVSFQAMTARLEKLGVLSPPELAELRKTKPSALAKKLPRPAGPRKKITVRQLQQVLTDLISRDPKISPTAETVRLLQEAAFARYARMVPEIERGETPGTIYEKVATWVADQFPLHRPAASSIP